MATPRETLIATLDERLSKTEQWRGITLPMQFIKSGYAYWICTWMCFRWKTKNKDTSEPHPPIESIKWPRKTAMVSGWKQSAPRQCRFCRDANETICVCRDCGNHHKRPCEVCFSTGVSGVEVLDGVRLNSLIATALESVGAEIAAIKHPVMPARSDGSAIYFRLPDKTEGIVIEVRDE